MSDSTEGSECGGIYHLKRKRSRLRKELQRQKLHMNHRVTGWLRLEGMSGCQQVQHLCSIRDLWNQFPRTVSRWLYNMSRKGDSTTSLGKLCQCSFTSTVKSVSWCPERMSCVWGCIHYLLSCHCIPLERDWFPLKKDWFHLLYILPSDPTFFTSHLASPD